MDELLTFLFSAAIHFSGLPANEARPSIQPMPYEAMLQEICIDKAADAPQLQALYSQCVRSHRMMPSACSEFSSELEWYGQCTRQRGLMAAYILQEHRIVYRDDLDLESDIDNSFIVHEYVHALQDQHFGDRIFATCQDVLSSEKQAYAAQQAYLRSRGQLLQVGERLKLVSCSDIR